MSAKRERGAKHEPKEPGRAILCLLCQVGGCGLARRVTEIPLVGVTVRGDRRRD
jgi:hypothetical protein